MSFLTNARANGIDKSSSGKTSFHHTSSAKKYDHSTNNALQSVMQLQMNLGNRATKRLYRSGILQAKLNIGPANDRYEQEADRIADRVVSMPNMSDNVAENSTKGNRQISRSPLLSISSLASSITPLQRVEAPEDDKMQKAGMPEEESQAKLQRAAEKEDEPQAKLQRAAEKEDEPQAKLQREAKPEEEGMKAQAKRIQRKCASCAKEEAQAKRESRPVNQAKLCPQCSTSLQRKKQMLQRKFFLYRKNNNTQTSVTSAPDHVESSLEAARGGAGRPLSTGERAYFEPRFGADFSGVKIHTDARAHTLARSVNARAFTVGRDIFFGGGQYSPNTGEGKRLMAHELTHTVQQRGYTQKTL